MTHVATLISHPKNPKITDTILSAVSAKIDRDASPTWLDPTVACDIPLSSQEVEPFSLLRPELDKAEIDLVIQEEATRRKSILLADMDSTMIEQECIDELADAIGIKGKVAGITERAMRGEIAFDPALRERVGLLKGLSLNVIDEVVAGRITLRSGGRELVQTMRQNKGYTALVSGGFTMFTSRIGAMLGFDENRANVLLTEGDELSGKVQEPILGAEAKLEALREICANRNVTPDAVMAIGDGANDLAMIKVAGSGVAVHAKPKVAAEARFSINHGDLTALLFMQGYCREDFAS